MKKIKILFTSLLLINLMACGTEEAEKKECCEKPDSLRIPMEYNKESLYQFEGEWLDQNGEKVELKKFSGKVQVLAMIFTSCAYACPRIVADMQVIESEIPADKQKEVNYLLISFDVARDTPEKLKSFSREMGLNDNWTLLHGTEQQVQEFSVALGLKFEKQEDGNFAHSNLISILDQNGAIALQQEGLGTDSGKPIEMIVKLLK